MSKGIRGLRLFRVVAFVAAVGLVAGGLASCATPPPSAPPTPEVIRETVVVEQTVVVPATPEAAKEPIRVGMSQPLTGPLAFIGEHYNMGLTMAADELNIEGGILGYPVQVFVCDNEALAEKAIACTRRLVDQDHVDVIIGMGSSATALAAMPLMEEYEVPFIGASITAPSVTENTGRAGGNIWTFRICPHEGMTARALSSYMLAQGDTISMVAWNSAAAREGIQVVTEIFEASGGEVLSEDYFESGTADYRPTLTRLKGLDPDMIYLTMQSRDGAIFMRQWRELSMTPKVFTADIVGNEFLEAIADDVSIGEGLMEAAGYVEGLDPEFEQRFYTRWGIWPESFSAECWVDLKYIVAEAVRLAIEEAGEPSPSAIRDGLENLSIDVPIYGHIEFDEHNQAYPDIGIMTIRDGEIVVLEMVPTSWQ